MKARAPRIQPLTMSAMLLALLWLGGSSAFAGSTVRLSEDDGSERRVERSHDEDSPAWHRKLWNGSFDAASDASGAAARMLEGVDFGNCDDYLKPRDGKPGSQRLFDACVQRQRDSGNFAQQARSIQKQQKTISLLSKASDVAALGAVGATIYGEMGVKQGNQSNTYESAANIQRKAGQVSYVTGASDLMMGAYAYVAHKNKLEQMKNTVTGANGRVRAESDPAVSGALTNAVEAAKKAAYNHMLYGAGKVAAGYGMMYLSKRTEEQANRMRSIDEIKEYDAILAARAASANGGAAPVPQVIPSGSGTVPYYQNNQPVFNVPNASGGSQSVSPKGPVTYTLPGGGTGSSAPLSPTQARAVASAAAGKITGGGGGSGGGSPEGGGAHPAAEGEDSAKEKAEKAAKETMGNSFEMQLTGGVHNSGGGPSASGGAAETPNLASLLGNPADGGAKTAATGLSPAQVYNEALEGTEGTEQGSMSGVSGKRESSLFDITKAKLTKMFQVGNVGIPKNVEVKN